MSRRKRLDFARQIYHVLNRANARLPIFDQQIYYDDYLAVLSDGLKKYKIDLYAYIVMPNHWHLVLSPKKDGEMSKFMQWVTMTHTQRWHSKRKTIGTGHLYQGRYKSFLIKNNHYFLQVCRYVEGNALRSGLVERAEDWDWSSLYQRNKKSKFIKLAPWPVPKPKSYLNDINNSQPREQIINIEDSIRKHRPFGDVSWLLETVGRYGIRSTLTEVGRPKK